jgi:hypothetical protein
MDKDDKKLVQKVHRRQRVRHVVANKLQLALLALQELRDGRIVAPRLIKRAVFDLRVILRFLDRQARSERSNKRG